MFTLLPASRHVTIGFARGTQLPDPAGLLAGTGTRCTGTSGSAPRRTCGGREPAELFATALARFARPS